MELSLFRKNNKFQNMANLLELQQRNGQLVLVKRNFYDLVNE
jgi:hypothetical protein